VRNSVTLKTVAAHSSTRQLSVTRRKSLLYFDQITEWSASLLVTKYSACHLWQQERCVSYRIYRRL